MKSRIGISIVLSALLGCSSLAEGDSNVTCQSLGKSLLGNQEAAALQMISEAGFVYRISQRDGEAFMLTHDFVDNRINLNIYRGAVKSVTCG